MTPIADMVERMLAAGVAHDMIVLAVQTAEASVRDIVRGISAEKVDESAERRRQKDRDRKANVRGNPQNSAELSPFPPSSPSSSSFPPTPPIITTLSPSPPNPPGTAPSARPTDQVVMPFPSEPRGKPPAEPIDQDADLFRRGREIFGKSAGGLVTKLLLSQGKSVAKARAKLEEASTRHDPREYLGAIIANRDKQEREERPYSPII